MRVTERLDLIDSIARTLQERYTYSDIDLLLGAFGIAQPTNVTSNSKWIYSKAALGPISEGLLLKVAAELDIVHNGERAIDQSPPRNWEGTTNFKLFISHISKDKDKAVRLKECLAHYNISGFVAHEDIHPTLEWQHEIERALRTMDAFIAVHTKGFSASFWAQQEIGFAVCRGVKIISFRMGEDPVGFIGQRQALSQQKRTAEEIAKEIDVLLTQDSQTSERLAAAKQPAFGSFEDDDVPF